MTEKKQQEKSVLQDLWDRRFFQFVGSYFAVSFGILQFGQFIENRYDLEMLLVEKLFLFLMVMLPAFVIYIYNHGRPGHDKWLHSEKIIVPTSFVLALLASLFVFNPQASAATESVSITTEEGDIVTRVIPTADFTKRLVVFPFTNNTGENENDWLRVAGSYLLDKDVEQDMRIFSVQALSLKFHYESYNQQFLDEIPFSTQLKIAQDLYTDFFVVSSIAKDSENLTLDAKVYTTENGQELYTDQITGSDIFELIDQFSKNLSKQLYPVEMGTSFSQIDLPVSNLVSQNDRALKKFIEGNILKTEDVRNLNMATQLVESSVEIDPDCAECYSTLTSFYYAGGQIDKARESIEKALMNTGSLPERQQLNMSFTKYLVNDEYEKSILLLENWRKLYPNDYSPYDNLMNFYSRMLEWDKAKAVGLEALDKGHKGNLLVTLANLYTKTEEYDEAEKLLEQFAELYPHKAKEKALLGDIYISKGELGKAKNLYNELVLLDPSDTKNLQKLGDIEDRTGNFDKAMAYYSEVLRKSNQTQDSLSVYAAIEGHYERLGQYEKSFQTAALREKITYRLAPPSLIRFQMLVTNDVKLFQVGKEEEFKRKMAELIEILPQRAPIIDCIGGFIYHMATEDKAGLKSTTEECYALLRQNGGANWDYLREAGMASLNEDYAGAAAAYETYIDSTGSGAKLFSSELSEVYRKGGQLDKAKDLMNRLLLEDPSNPTLLVEKARVLHASGIKTDAKELYDRAMDIWKDADENYKNYTEAITFGKELEGIE